MCEKLAEYIQLDARDRFYTVGLLSCLDAFFDQQLLEIVKSISLDDAISDALLNFKGPAGLALHTTLNFEKSQWHKINWQALSKYELTVKLINEIYFDTTKLALEISS